MSASREKKKRLTQDGSETAPVVQGKKGLSKTAKRAIAIIVAIALVAVIVFFGMLTTGFFEKHTTAAVVNGNKLTPAMVNYYYNGALQENQQYISMTADPEASLKDQPSPFDESGSWSDFLMNVAMKNASEAYALYDEAMKNGYTISAEGQESIDQNVEGASAMAAMYGYPNADSLLVDMYGKGCNEKTYREYLTINTIANEYANATAEGLTYTQEDMDAYYAEHTDDLDGYNFRTYPVVAEKDEEGKVSDEAMKAAEEAAKMIADAGVSNEQGYLDAVAADYNAKNAPTEDGAEAPAYDADQRTLNEDYAPSYLSEALHAWILEDGRQVGDTAYLPNSTEDGYDAVYYIGQADHSYLLPSVRHALFSVDAEAPDQEAAWATAEADAQAALDEYLAGDKTEEAFAAIATAKSSDTGSAANGGLYDHVFKGQMVPEFDAWCFDEARKPGDTGIVKTDFGYHVMYYVGAEQSLHDFLVENTMRSEDFNAWKEAVLADSAFEIVSDKFVELH